MPNVITLTLVSLSVAHVSVAIIVWNELTALQCQRAAGPTIDGHFPDKQTKRTFTKG